MLILLMFGAVVLGYCKIFYFLYFIFMLKFNYYVYFYNINMSFVILVRNTFIRNINLF